MQKLGVFAKYWQPGAVKSRLAVDLGDAVAAQLHLAFLTATLRRFDEAAMQRWLVVSPAGAIGQFESLTRDRWRLEPQSEGDLGRRLDHFSVKHATSSRDQLIIVGADSPNLPLDRISAAFASLESRKAVLGPTTDGGYYLIGVRGEARAILEGIDWQRGDVLEQTIARFDQAAWSYELLPPWYDVDVLADLKRLRNDLATGRRGDPHLDELNTAIQGIILNV